ncbi:unnamed protein product [Caenorhabditis angaria]|uniref:Uncharacterized protein n=1 Tax=Caenorhabditis angaria TaxID=860376 RepID=A0A9P1I4E5_9PELO|nr:unnamed protein product [Caenorhabditis angaria]
MLKLLMNREIGEAQNPAQYYPKLLYAKSITLEKLDYFDDQVKNLGFSPNGYDHPEKVLRPISKMRLTQNSDDIVHFKEKKVPPFQPSQTNEEIRAQLLDIIKHDQTFELDFYIQEALRTGDSTRYDQYRKLNNITDLTIDEIREYQEEHHDYRHLTLFSQLVRDFRDPASHIDKNIFVIFDLNTGRVISKLSIFNAMECCYMNNRILSVINKYNENIDVYEVTENGSFSVVKRISGFIREPYELGQKQMETHYQKHRHNTHIRQRILNSLYKVYVPKTWTFIQFYQNTQKITPTNLIPLDNSKLAIFWQLSNDQPILTIIDYDDVAYFDIFYDYNGKFRYYLFQNFDQYLPATLGKLNDATQAIEMFMKSRIILKGIPREEHFPRFLKTLQILRNIQNSMLSPFLNPRFLRFPHDFIDKLFLRIKEYNNPTIFDVEWMLMDMPCMILCPNTRKLIVKSHFMKIEKNPETMVRQSDFLCQTIPYFHPIDLFFIFGHQKSSKMRRNNNIKSR